MAKANRLGKGLSAIISTARKSSPDDAARPAGGGRVATAPPAETTTAEAVSAATPPEQIVHTLPVEQVIPNRNQPRSVFDETALAELSASIAAQGLLQPVVVRPAQDGKYELIAGERRWRAARAAGLDRIPALVRDVSNEESVELALIENLQREDLNALERAVAYQNYLDTFGKSAEDLAQRLGESRANVANYLRLLGLHVEVQGMLERGELNMGHARALAGVMDQQRQLGLARLAIRRNLSVRQVEALTRETPEPREKPAPNLPSKHLEDVQRSLSKSLGLPVSLQPSRRKNAGRIVIRYASLEEFDRIAERLSGDSTLD